MDGNIQKIISLKPLPLWNTCKEACSDCCSPVVPLSGVEEDDIRDFLAEHKDRGAVAALILNAKVHQAEKICPFLTADHKCFVYDVRPEMCQMFGHVKVAPPGMVVNLRCPHEVRGEVRFTEMSPEEEKRRMDKMHEDVQEHGWTMTGELGLRLLAEKKKADRKAKKKW